MRAARKTEDFKDQQASLGSYLQRLNTQIAYEMDKVLGEIRTQHQFALDQLKDTETQYQEYLAKLEGIAAFQGKIMSLSKD